MEYVLLTTYNNAFCSQVCNSQCHILNSHFIISPGTSYISITLNILHTHIIRILISLKCIFILVGEKSVILVSFIYFYNIYWYFEWIFFISIFSCAFVVFIILTFILSFDSLLFQFQFLVLQLYLLQTYIISVSCQVKFLSGLHNIYISFHYISINENHF